MLATVVFVTLCPPTYEKRGKKKNKTPHWWQFRCKSVPCVFRIVLSVILIYIFALNPTGELTEVGSAYLLYVQFRF